VSIFVLPPSVEELVTRLGGRGTDRPADLQQRLRRAVEELGEAHHYDYLVVNDDRTQAVAEVAAIIDAESRRTRRQHELLERVQELRRGLTEVVARLSRPAGEQGKG
jgi:guanylate kinase